MKQIAVYVDQGVDGMGLKALVKSLYKEVDLDQYLIRRINASTLKTADWEKETALLIIPGGRDIYYHTALEGCGTDKIRRFVEKGGYYLGLSGGAYFASSEVEFEKGGKLQVCARRSLSFYPGRAVGPAYGADRFSFETQSGVEAALIARGQENHFVYYNGGCFFDSDRPASGVLALANYKQLQDEPPAIVACPVGKGLAILSGVHLEFSSEFLPRNDEHVERIYPFLSKDEEKRRDLFRDILSRFSINLTNSKK